MKAFGQAGFTEDDDWLPGRFYSQPIVLDGRPVLCSRQDFGRMHREYYEAMGWDGHGRPTRGTLEKLGLTQCFGDRIAAMINPEIT